MRRKQASKRRWKARYNLGKPVPSYVIFNYRLDYMNDPEHSIHNISTCRVRKRAA